MKRLLIFISFSGLSACAIWNPKIGMSTEEFDSMCFKSGLSYKSQIVEAEGVKEVRVCGSGNNRFYYFNNDKLIRIDQGYLPQQRIQIEVK